MQAMINTAWINLTMTRQSLSVQPWDYMQKAEAIAPNNPR
jgi:hypothetical protein